MAGPDARRGGCCTGAAAAVQWLTSRDLWWLGPPVDHQAVVGVMGDRAPSGWPRWCAGWRSAAPSAGGSTG
ncbi:hypothetical protein NKH18_35570 [Streptomyces sp. M10(2022)]